MASKGFYLITNYTNKFALFLEMLTLNIIIILYPSKTQSALGDLELCKTGKICERFSRYTVSFL